MNRDQAQDDGKQSAGRVGEKRRRLTHDDLTVIAKVSEQLSGILRGDAATRKPRRRNNPTNSPRD